MFNVVMDYLPEDDEQWVTYGASTRAAQYLVLGGKGARAHAGALSRLVR
jgi:hypothetical protein